MTSFPADPWISPNHITAPWGPMNVSNLTWSGPQRQLLCLSFRVDHYEDLAVTCNERLTACVYMLSACCMPISIGPWL